MLNAFDVKAVRRCCGFTTDLRHAIEVGTNDYTPQEETIRNFLIDHVIALYGYEYYKNFGMDRPPVRGVDIEGYTAFMEWIDKEARNVCYGFHS